MDSSPAKGLHSFCCGACSVGTTRVYWWQETSKHILRLNANAHLSSAPHQLFFLAIPYTLRLWFLLDNTSPRRQDKRGRWERWNQALVKHEETLTLLEPTLECSVFLSPRAFWFIRSISSRYKSFSQLTGGTITTGLKDWLLSPASTCLQVWLSDKSSQINLYPKE